MARKGRGKKSVVGSVVDYVRVQRNGRFQATVWIHGKLYGIGAHDIASRATAVALWAKSIVSLFSSSVDTATLLSHIRAAVNMQPTVRNAIDGRYTGPAELAEVKVVGANGRERRIGNVVANAVEEAIT